jgi:hypothetical protein
VPPELPPPQADRRMSAEMKATGWPRPRRRPAK